MSGTKYKSEMRPEAILAPSKSFEDDESIEHLGEDGDTSPRKYPHRHLGPISRADRVISVLNKVTPYMIMITIIIKMIIIMMMIMIMIINKVTPYVIASTLIIILFLLATIIANIRKVCVTLLPSNVELQNVQKGFKYLNIFMNFYNCILNPR